MKRIAATAIAILTFSSASLFGQQPASTSTVWEVAPLSNLSFLYGMHVGLEVKRKDIGASFSVGNRLGMDGFAPVYRSDVKWYFHEKKHRYYLLTGLTYHPHFLRWGTASVTTQKGLKELDDSERANMVDIRQTAALLQIGANWRLLSGLYVNVSAGGAYKIVSMTRNDAFPYGGAGSVGRITEIIPAFDVGLKWFFPLD